MKVFLTILFAFFLGSVSHGKLADNCSDAFPGLPVGQCEPLPCVSTCTSGCNQKCFYIICDDPQKTAGFEVTDLPFEFSTYYDKGCTNKKKEYVINELPAKHEGAVLFSVMPKKGVKLTEWACIKLSTIRSCPRACANGSGGGFGGGVTISGGSVHYYSVGSVPSSGSCSSYYSSTTCTNGTWSSGSPGSHYASCTRNCSINGEEVASGDARTYYNTSQVVLPGTCSSHRVTYSCSNGFVSPSYNPAYSQTACVEVAPPSPVPSP